MGLLNFIFEYGGWSGVEELVRDDISFYANIAFPHHKYLARLGLVEPF